MGKTDMPAISFDTHPDAYRHWNLSFDGPIARLEMDVSEVDSVDGSTDLVLNSYDLGVEKRLAGDGFLRAVYGSTDSSSDV